MRTPRRDGGSSASCRVKARTSAGNSPGRKGSKAVLCGLLTTGMVGAAFPAMADKLKIAGIPGGDEVVVMINARTAAGCEVRVSRSTGESEFGNLLAGCKPWIAVLAADKAMLLKAPADKWTNDADDEDSVTLKPTVDVPVRVWIANPAAANKAVDDMARANLVYERNKVGIQFVPKYEDVPADSVEVINDAIVITEDGEFKCRKLRELQQSAFYVTKTLNVYYVKEAITGRNCAITQPNGDGNITFIGSAANRATLAHEFGHAFGLRPMDAGGHTDGLPGFGSTNLMFGNGTAARKRLTAGQVFRMNTHADQWGGTMLIENGLRPGPGRKCPPDSPPPTPSNEQCPPLDADP